MVERRAKCGKCDYMYAKETGKLYTYEGRDN
jgi:hypothetical protein